MNGAQPMNYLHYTYKSYFYIDSIHENSGKINNCRYYFICAPLKPIGDGGKNLLTKGFYFKKAISGVLCLGLHNNRAKLPGL